MSTLYLGRIIIDLATSWIGAVGIETVLGLPYTVEHITLHSPGTINMFEILPATVAETEVSSGAETGSSLDA